MARYTRAKEEILLLTTAVTVPSANASFVDQRIHMYRHVTKKHVRTCFLGAATGALRRRRATSDPHAALA